MRDANRRRIFFLCRELGIDDEVRRDIQFSACGKRSLKDMDDVAALSVIELLKVEKWKLDAGKSVRRGEWRNKLPHGENVVNLMTPDQRRKIVAMSMQIYGRFSEKTMDKFCNRQFKKPLRKLQASEAIRLIEIQKTLLKRKMRDGEFNS